MLRRASPILAVGLLVLGAGSVVRAQVGSEAGQETSELEEDDRAGAEGPSAPAPRDVDGDADLTYEQMLAEAQEIQAMIEQSSRAIGRMLRDARSASDVVQQLCLDDKLNQIDVAGQSAADRVLGMAGAAQAGDPVQLRREYSVMQALAESAEILAAEANLCIGEEKGSIGGASLNVTADPEIPREASTAGADGASVMSPPNTMAVQPRPPIVDPPIPSSPVM